MDGAILIILGVALVATALIEAFLTMLGMRGGGPITNAWSRAAWRVALAAHRRRPIHTVLSLAGPTFMVGAVLSWYVLLVAGWLLIFGGSVPAVVVSETGAPATIGERLSFVGSTVSLVGYGDLAPSGLSWTMVAAGSAFTGTFLLTLSLSYLMPVISAALQRRQLAQDVSAIGDSPIALVRESWTGHNPGLLNVYWADTLRDLNRHAHQHLVYPVLHYFHSGREDQSHAVATLRLADALFLISQTTGPERPPDGLLQLWRGAMRRYAEMKGVGPPDDEEELETPDHLSRSAIERLGLEPVDEERFQKALDEYAPLRRRLVTLLRDDGW